MLHERRPLGTAPSGDLRGVFVSLRILGGAIITELRRHQRQLESLSYDDRDISHISGDSSEVTVAIVLLSCHAAASTTTAVDSDAPGPTYFASCDEMCADMAAINGGPKLTGDAEAVTGTQNA